jgi:hypothetical protein
VPPDHLLDLRSKVRLRHTLVDQRGEWQQRIRAVLYHHGLAHRRELHLLSPHVQRSPPPLGSPPIRSLFTRSSYSTPVYWRCRDGIDAARDNQP